MDFDIIIVGGSFAGQAAAIQLGRARRRVLLLDAGQPRNRFARASHGFLGQDGYAPAAIMATAKLQLAKYGTVEQRAGRAVEVHAIEGGFQLLTEDAQTIRASRLILATGVKDSLPGIPGMQERWGSSVLHCPYCHGFELNQQPLGVLASSELAMHQAMLVPDWGPTTLFTQAAFTPNAEQEAQLIARGVQIEKTPIAELLGSKSGLEAVRLQDGRIVAISGLFVAPKTELASDLAIQLGCKLTAGPTGAFIAVDPMQHTSVPGVFAAGDAASPMANATIAAAAGVMAAGGAHHSLIYGLAEQAGASSEKAA